MRLFPCAAFLWLFSAPLNAATIQFSTADSPFTPGLANQGWYARSSSNRTIADNYTTGFFFANGSESRGYFSFDLRALAAQVTSAHLKIRIGSRRSPLSEETLGIFSVETDAAALNNRTGNTSHVYSDLGSGLLMKAPVTTGQLSNTLQIELAPLALAEINAKRGGFVSFGFALQSIARTADQYLFYGTDRLPGLLEIDTAPESGDFTGDGIVNAADLQSWQNNFGTPAMATRSQGDADNDGDVDGGDMLVWQRQVGVNANTSISAVPEPSAAALILFALSGPTFLRRERAAG
jgi:hypothetical protein